MGVYGLESLRCRVCVLQAKGVGYFLSSLPLPTKFVCGEIEHGGAGVGRGLPQKHKRGGGPYPALLADRPAL